MIIQQDQDFPGPGELDDNMDIIIQSDPPEQEQEDPRDNHQDDQGARLNNLFSNGQCKYRVNGYYNMQANLQQFM